MYSFDQLLDPLSKLTAFTRGLLSGLVSTGRKGCTHFQSDGQLLLAYNCIVLCVLTPDGWIRSLSVNGSFVQSHSLHICQADVKGLQAGRRQKLQGVLDVSQSGSGRGYTLQDCRTPTFKRSFPAENRPIYQKPLRPLRSIVSSARD